MKKPVTKIPAINDSPQLITRVQIDPQYKHVAQFRSLCGTAILEMIFKRRGRDSVDQVQLAKDLGTKISKELPGEFPAELPFAEKPEDAGTHITVFIGEQMKVVFGKYNLPLITQLYHADEINNLINFLAANLRAGNDILVNFVDILGKSKLGTGHYALISAVDSENNTVTLCDPWQGNDNFYEVTVHDLAKQMNTIDPMGNKRGMVVFREMT